MTTLRCVNDWVLCDLVQPLHETAGGIALPETFQRNDSTAVVLAVGPGLALTGGRRAEQSVEPGDVVLVDAAATWPAPDGREVFIKDRDLLAILDGDEVRPLNDLVWVRPDHGVSQVGEIVIPDACHRRRARCGTVRATGNGRVRLTGRLRGTRIPISSTIAMEMPVGTKVHWEHEADPYAVGRHSCAGLLIRAEKLCAHEGNEDAEGR